jgi:hypothetical protein
METATALVPATLVSFVDRRRAGSVPPRGVPFVERRRPAPVFVVEADDLHTPDADRVMGDALEFAFGSGVNAPFVAARLAGRIRPAAFAVHALRPEAADLLR